MNNSGLILVSANNIENPQDFNLYEFKHNVKLIVNNKEIKPIDFYDTKLSQSGHTYFSDISLSYTASYNLDVIGYLLFPKDIDFSSLKELKLKVDYQNINKTLKGYLYIRKKNIYESFI